MKKTERPLAYSKAREISYTELNHVTGGANKATSRLDRCRTHHPSGPDEIVQVIPD